MDRPYLNSSLSWADCKEIVAKDRLELLGRSHAQHAIYHSFMANVTDKYESVADFLLESKFQLPVATDQISGKLRAEVGGDTPDRLVLAINDFPYHYEKGIVHYVLWKIGSSLIDSEIIEAQRSLLEDKQIGAADACWYVNPTNLKSILTIDHAHILLYIPSQSAELDGCIQVDAAQSTLQRYSHLLLNPTAQGLLRASELLSSGQLVAFPTETVYGLGANALNVDAVLSIFAAKGRPLTDPLIVHVTDAFAAQSLLELSPAEQEIFSNLSAAFWPGPLTIIAKAASIIPAAITANTGFVGVRVPAHGLALALLQACKLPIAAPSANRFGHVSPTRAAHVLDDLGEKGVHVLDGDYDGAAKHVTEDATLSAGASCEHGIESTVAKIDGSSKSIIIFRQGAVTARRIEESLRMIGFQWEVRAVTRTVQMAHAVTCSSSSTHSASTDTDIAEGQEAPGQAITHYAPDIPCFTITSTSFSSSTPATSEQVLVLTRTELANAVVIDYNSQLACLLSDDGNSGTGLLAYRDLSRSGNSRHAARNLFDYLRWAESIQGATRVLLAKVDVFEEVSEAGEGGLSLGLHDRMFRASSGQTRELVVLES